MPLPPADAFGNYWLGQRAQPPAILPIRSVPAQAGKYLLLADDGCVFADGGGFLAFATPESALKDLAGRRRLAADLFAPKEP